MRFNIVHTTIDTTIDFKIHNTYIISKYIISQIHNFIDTYNMHVFHSFIYKSYINDYKYSSILTNLQFTVLHKMEENKQNVFI